MNNDNPKVNKNLFYRLTNLFKSGPVVKKKVRSFSTNVMVPDSSKSSASLLFQKNASAYSIMNNYANNSSERFARYQDFQSMEYTPEIASALDIFCLAPETVILLPLSGDGTSGMTIKQLYDNNVVNFYVCSYDYETNKPKIGFCNKVLKTGENQQLYRVTFDDHSSIRLTENHLVLLANGTYERVKNLSEGSIIRSVHVLPKNPNWSKNLEMISSSTQIVDSVIADGIDDVYDLHVDKWHNFAISSTDNSTTWSIVHNSDETVSVDEKGRSLHVYSDNEKIRELLEDLFYNTLNTEFHLRPWTRSLCKFGDHFLLLDVSPEYGVVSAFPIPVAEIMREEGFDADDPYAVRYRWITHNKTLENWEIAHFRLLGNDSFLPYGSSVIEAARRIWRQLILIEDAMLVYRVVRAPERRVFYIDVGNMPPEDIPLHLEQQRKQLRTNQVVDNQTGDVDLRHNVSAIMEDYFIPVRGQDTGTKIDTLAGGQNAAAVEDVAYIQKKLFAALKIPRAYLGYDETVGSKATLAQLDVRFSRTISVIQKTIISELNKIAIIHLYANGYENEDLQNFVLRLSNPSSVAQQQKLELWRSKFEIGGSAPEGYVNKDFIRKQIWGLSNEECEEIDAARLRDKLMDASIENAQIEPADSSDDSMDNDSFDLGGGDIGGGDESDTEPSPEAEEPSEENAGETPLEDEEPDLELLTSSIDNDDEENYSVKLSLDSSPIKPQSQLKRALYNRSRQRKSGASQTHLPDLYKMSSKDQTSKDPFDSNFTRDLISNPFGESKTYHNVDVGLRPAISSDILSCLSKMENRLSGIRKQGIRNSLLHEHESKKIIFGNDEELLIINDDVEADE